MDRALPPWEVLLCGPSLGPRRLSLLQDYAVLPAVWPSPLPPLLLLRWGEDRAPSRSMPLARAVPLVELHHDGSGGVVPTTSITRRLSDLDQSLFLFYAFVLCALRTMVQQPMNLALARKQTCTLSRGMSTVTLLRLVYRHEGRWRGLGQGMVSMTLACALSEVVYLFLFEYGRENFRLPARVAVAADGCTGTDVVALPLLHHGLARLSAVLENEMSRDALSGYVADSACRCLHIPLSIAAYRQMTERTTRCDIGNRVEGRGPVDGRTKSTLRTLRDVYRERGTRSLFAGYGTTLLIGCQWTAVWWALYGQMKESMYAGYQPLLLALQADLQTPGTNGANATPWHACAGGAVLRRLPRSWLSPDDNVLLNSAASITTSAATAVLFNPFLVLRTKLQVTSHSSLFSVAKLIATTQGWRGFYAGLGLNVVACVVDGALASTSYEYAKLWSDRTQTALARP